MIAELAERTAVLPDEAGPRPAVADRFDAILCGVDGR